RCTALRGHPAPAVPERSAATARELTWEYPAPGRVWKPCRCCCPHAYPDLTLPGEIIEGGFRGVGPDRGDTICHGTFAGIHLAFANGLSVGGSQYEEER